MSYVRLEFKISEVWHIVVWNLLNFKSEFTCVGPTTIWFVTPSFSFTDFKVSDMSLLLKEGFLLGIPNMWILVSTGLTKFVGVETVLLSKSTN